MSDLVLRPSAKINLALHVGARRADGYHDVRTVLQSIGIFDELRLQASRGPFTLTTNAPDLPADETNLVWRAAQVLWTALRRDGAPKHARVTLIKRIPMGAGLGGGSADAAAALVGLHRLWKGRLAVADLQRLGATLGADVPFFLVGGTALGVNRGDDVYPLVDARRLGVVVVQPPFGVATADAYRWFDEQPGGPVPPAGQPAGGAGEAVRLGWPTRPLPLVNDLQAPVVARHPVLADMLWACRAAGAVGAGMTGSGAAVFGLFELGAVAQAARTLERKSDGWRIWPTRTLARRDAVRRIGL